MMRSEFYRTTSAYCIYLLNPDGIVRHFYDKGEIDEIFERAGFKVRQSHTEEYPDYDTPNTTEYFHCLIAEAIKS